MQTSGTLQAWRDDVGRRYLNLDFRPANVSHFNRLSRRRYGCTPSAIRSGPGKN